MRNNYVRGDNELRNKLLKESFNNGVKKKLKKIFKQFKEAKKKNKSKDDDKDNKRIGADDKMFTVNMGEELIRLFAKILAPVVANIIIKHVFYTKNGQLYLQIKLNSSICKLGTIVVHYAHGEFIAKMKTGLGNEFKWKNESLFDVPSTVSLIAKKMVQMATAEYIPTKTTKKNKRKKKIVKKAKHTGAMHVSIIKAIA